MRDGKAASDQFAVATSRGAALLKSGSGSDIVCDDEFDGFLPQALEQEWTVDFIVENIDSLPTGWIYASLAVCLANRHLAYASIIRTQLEYELSVRKAREFR